MSPMPEMPRPVHRLSWAERRKLAVLRLLDKKAPNIYLWVGCRGFRPNGATCVPDKFWFVPSIKAIADLHDWMYHFATIPRHDADIAFRKNIRALARLMPKRVIDLPVLRGWSRCFWAVQTRKLRAIAQAYYLGVRKFGQSHFDPLGLRSEEWAA